MELSARSPSLLPQVLQGLGICLFLVKDCTADLKAHLFRSKEANYSTLDHKTRLSTSRQAKDSMEDLVVPLSILSQVKYSMVCHQTPLFTLNRVKYRTARHEIFRSTLSEDHPPTHSTASEGMLFILDLVKVWDPISLKTHRISFPAQTSGGPILQHPPTTHIKIIQLPNPQHPLIKCSSNPHNSHPKKT